MARFEYQLLNFYLFTCFCRANVPSGLGVPVIMHFKMTSAPAETMVSWRGNSNTGASMGSSSADTYESSEESKKTSAISKTAANPFPRNQSGSEKTNLTQIRRQRPRATFLFFSSALLFVTCDDQLSLTDLT